MGAVERPGDGPQLRVEAELRESPRGEAQAVAGGLRRPESNGRFDGPSGSNHERITW